MVRPAGSQKWTSFRRDSAPEVVSPPSSCGRSLGHEPEGSQKSPRAASLGKCQSLSSVLVLGLDDSLAPFGGRWSLTCLHGDIIQTLFQPTQDKLHLIRVQLDATTLVLGCRSGGNDDSIFAVADRYLDRRAGFDAPHSRLRAILWLWRRRVWLGAERRRGRFPAPPATLRPKAALPLTAQATRLMLDHSLPSQWLAHRQSGHGP